MPEVADLWNDECAQDVTEYSLLLAFIATVTVAIFGFGGGGVAGIWGHANNSLTSAVSASS